MAQTDIRRGIEARFGALRTVFPDLTFRMQADHPHVDISVAVPRQPGLAFGIELIMQNDELHLSSGAFRLVWSPCFDADVVTLYFGAVENILTGRYRIVEYQVCKRTVMAKLQRPVPTGWETIGTWSGPGRLIPWRRNVRILQNKERAN